MCCATLLDMSWGCATLCTSGLAHGSILKLRIEFDNDTILASSSAVQSIIDAAVLGIAV